MGILLLPPVLPFPMPRAGKAGCRLPDRRVEPPTTTTADLYNYYLLNEFQSSPTNSPARGAFLTGLHPSAHAGGKGKKKLRGYSVC